MMKILLAALAGLVALILVIGLVAPKDFTVERQVIINKPKDTVFRYLKSLKNGNEWNPWSKQDPNIRLEYKGVDGAVGSVLSWSGNDKVGAGEQEIKSIKEGERIDFELRFKKPMQATNTAYLIAEPQGADRTRVRWGMVGRTRFPGNILCMLMHNMLGKDFEKGLASLKMQLDR